MPIFEPRGQELIPTPCDGWVVPTAVLACPGPSLAKWKTETLDLAVSNALGHEFSVVAINTAYPKIRPTLWIGCDGPENFVPALADETFRKIFRVNFTDAKCVDGKLLRQKPKTYFATFALGSEVESKLKTGQSVPEETHEKWAQFMWRGNTFTSALDILIWMRVKKIILVGCDFGGVRDYYDERVLSGPAHQKNRLLYREIVDFMKSFYVPACEEAGIRLVSATPGSPLNSFMECLQL